MESECTAGPSGLQQPVRNGGGSNVNDLIPYGDYLGIWLPHTWGHCIPLRVKQILSAQCLQVWSTLFVGRVGGMKLPEAYHREALSDEDRWNLTDLVVNTLPHLVWEYEHDVCCPSFVKDMFRTRDFEKAFVRITRILRLTTDLKVLKLKEKTGRKLS